MHESHTRLLKLYEHISLRNDKNINQQTNLKINTVIRIKPVNVHIGQLVIRHNTADIRVYDNAVNKSVLRLQCLPKQTSNKSTFLAGTRDHLSLSAHRTATGTCKNSQKFKENI